MGSFTSTGIALAKASAGIPSVAGVAASIASPGAALPPSMMIGARTDTHIPQAMVYVDNSIMGMDGSHKL
jgi:hypothetical protein